jgi:hypothetical protein
LDDWIIWRGGEGERDERDLLRLEREKMALGLLRLESELPREMLAPSVDRFLQCSEESTGRR